jgi:dihydroflavonol-4-reductase
MRIAIIGATGMLGYHTALSAVNSGHEVVLVCRNPRLLEQIEDFDFTYEARQADLDDRISLRAALAGTDAVINCAAYYPTIPRPWQDDVRTATTQMQNFYAACADLPLRKIVYLGSAIALPREPTGRPEDDRARYSEAPHDKNPYLQVKWAMEEQAFAKAAEGLPVTIGIPTQTFGEFDKNGNSRLILEMANRTLPGFIQGRRNAIYSGDAGRGMVRVCEAGRVGERYLLTGENLTMRELIGKIAGATGTPMPKAIPVGVAKLIAAAQEFRYKYIRGPVPKVSTTVIAVMSMGRFLDGTKAERELGFKAAVSIDEAIRRALIWFRSKGLVKAA